jgi:hypothetical protein
LEIGVKAAVLVEINPRDLPKAGPEKAKAKTGVAASTSTTTDNSAMVTRDLVAFIISFGCACSLVIIFSAVKKVL